jgi:MULE transposase domain
MAQLRALSGRPDIGSNLPGFPQRISRGTPNALPRPRGEPVPGQGFTPRPHQTMVPPERDLLEGSSVAAEGSTVEGGAAAEGSAVEGGARALESVHAGAAKPLPEHAVAEGSTVEGGASALQSVEGGAANPLSEYATLFQASRSFTAPVRLDGNDVGAGSCSVLLKRGVYIKNVQRDVLITAVKKATARAGFISFVRTGKNQNLTMQCRQTRPANYGRKGGNEATPPPPPSVARRARRSTGSKAKPAKRSRSVRPSKATRPGNEEALCGWKCTFAPVATGFKILHISGDEHNHVRRDETLAPARAAGVDANTREIFSDLSATLTPSEMMCVTDVIAKVTDNQSLLNAHQKLFAYITGRHSPEASCFPALHRLAEDDSVTAIVWAELGNGTRRVINLEPDKLKAATSKENTASKRAERNVRRSTIGKEHLEQAAALLERQYAEYMQAYRKSNQTQRKAVRMERNDHQESGKSRAKQSDWDYFVYDGERLKLVAVLWCSEAMRARAMRNPWHIAADVVFGTANRKRPLWDACVLDGDHRSVPVARCFMLDETRRSFEFVFLTGLALLFGSKWCESVLLFVVDGDDACQSAISAGIHLGIFPNALVRECSFHIIVMRLLKIGTNTTEEVQAKERVKMFVNVAKFVDREDLVVALLALADFEASKVQNNSSLVVALQDAVSMLRTKCDKWSGPSFIDRYTDGFVASSIVEGLHGNLKTGVAAVSGKNSTDRSLKNFSVQDNHRERQAVTREHQGFLSTTLAGSERFPVYAQQAAQHLTQFALGDLLKRVERLEHHIIEYKAGLIHVRQRIPVVHPHVKRARDILAFFESDDEDAVANSARLVVSAHDAWHKGGHTVCFVAGTATDPSHIECACGYFIRTGRLCVGITAVLLGARHGRKERFSPADFHSRYLMLVDSGQTTIPLGILQGDNRPKIPTEGLSWALLESREWLGLVTLLGTSSVSGSDLVAGARGTSDALPQLDAVEVESFRATDLASTEVNTVVEDAPVLAAARVASDAQRTSATRRVARSAKRGREGVEQIFQEARNPTSQGRFNEVAGEFAKQFLKLSENDRSEYMASWMEFHGEFIEEHPLDLSKHDRRRKKQKGERR